MQQLSEARPHTRKLIGPALLALLVTACGGSGQDEGQISSANYTLSGRAIDGYIARATVYVDLNENGRRDASESYAFTDDQGYFSYNPKTGTDYCVSTATEEQSQYCLTVKQTLNNPLLSIDSGYDLQTGEPLTGQLSRRVMVNPDGSSRPVLVTPLTSVVSSTLNDVERQAVLNSLGLDDEDLDVDFLDSDGAGQVDLRLFAKALQLHKTTTVLAERLTHVYDAIGNELNTPNDASGIVYRSLADALATQTGADALADRAIILDVLARSRQELHELYVQRDFDLPYEEELNVDVTAQRAAATSQAIRVIVEQKAQQQAHEQQARARAAAKLVEILAKQAAKREVQASTFEGTRQFLTGNDKPQLQEKLFATLAGERGDISALVNRNLLEFESEQQIEQLAALPADAEPFAQVSGKRLRVSDPDLGHAPDDLRDSEVELYFSGEADAVSGPLKACIKFIDEAHSDGTLGKGNTRGELVSGYWSLLGATVDNNESYNLLLTLNFLGSRYQAIIKSAGKTVVSGVEHYKLRFDNNGDISDWESRYGLQVAVHVPDSSEECRARLPSRIWND